MFIPFLKGTRLHFKHSLTLFQALFCVTFTRKNATAIELVPKRPPSGLFNWPASSITDPIYYIRFSAKLKR